MFLHVASICQDVSMLLISGGWSPCSLSACNSFILLIKFKCVEYCQLTFHFENLSR